jgi:hypothetical protein
MALAISQNFSDLLIPVLANGATWASQVFIAAAPAGLRGMFNSVSTALLAVAGLKPGGGAMFSKLVPFGSSYL